VVAAAVAAAVEADVAAVEGAEDNRTIQEQL